MTSPTFTGRATWKYEQSRRGSFIEACTNVLIGYVVALLTQIAVFPLVGIHVDMKTNLTIGAIFTVVSIIRSYLVRRLFNRIRDGFFA